MQKKAILLLGLLLSIKIFPADLLKIGGYAGYFAPRDAVLKEIYSGGDDVVYGLKLGLRLWKGFYAWVSGMHYEKYSKTSFTDDITRLTLNPVAVSLRYTLELGKANPYLEGSYTTVFFKEKSDIGSVDDRGSGYAIDVGVEFNLGARFILDTGIKYSRVKVNPTGFDVELGGFQAGMSFLVKI